MFKNVFFRNARGRDLLDAFLISAITSLLGIRFYLHLTNYPQLGGSKLHIAHMLFGGMFMMIAIVLTLSFLGMRTRLIAAVVGGAGFGIFIDELGKFITKDNNYFFQPAIGLIYAIFVILYLTFNFLTRAQRLTSREYQINVLAELEEAIVADMDKAEKNRLYELLDSSNPKSPLTKQLRRFIDTLEINGSQKPSRLNIFFRKVDALYKRFWERRDSHALINTLFVTEVAVIVIGVIYTVSSNLEDIRSLFNGTADYSQEIIVAQIISSLVAGGFVIYGLVLLRKSRRAAFEQFRRATLINIYLTEFFAFLRYEFEALPGLIVNVVLLLLISFVLRQETRLGSTDARS